LLKLLPNWRSLKRTPGVPEVFQSEDGSAPKKPVTGFRYSE
jgi:hypothetical protein